MRSRNYFIIAGAAVLGFAGWYQDFARRADAIDAAQRAAAALEQDRVRVAREADRVEQYKRMVAQQEERRALAARKAEEAAAAQRDRDADNAALAAARDEAAALRVSRQRLHQALEHEARMIAAGEREAVALAEEQTFLAEYTARARDSVQRVGLVVAAVEQQRLQQAAAESTDGSASGARHAREARSP